MALPNEHTHTHSLARFLSHTHIFKLQKQLQDLLLSIERTHSLSRSLSLSPHKHIRTNKLQTQMQDTLLPTERTHALSFSRAFSLSTHTQRDCFYCIIKQTYDVGLHSSRHPDTHTHTHRQLANANARYVAAHWTHTRSLFLARFFSLDKHTHTHRQLAKANTRYVAAQRTGSAPGSNCIAKNWSCQTSESKPGALKCFAVSCIVLQFFCKHAKHPRRWLNINMVRTDLKAT